MDDLKIGHLLYDKERSKTIGALVHKITPINFVVFHFENQTSNIAVFSKLTYSDNIIKKGNINNIAYRSLKSALLKYYRTRKLSKLEESTLSAIMDYAFPNGIPEYNTAEQQVSEDTAISIGKKMFLNTTATSSVKHLNNATVMIMDMTPHGIWILDTKDDTQPQFLFKILDGGQYAGISRYRILGDVANFPSYIDKFKQMKTADITNIIYKGEKVIINVNDNAVIYPEKYANTNKYNADTDNLMDMSEQNNLEKQSLDENVDIEGIKSVQIGGGDEVLMDEVRLFDTMEDIMPNESADDIKLYNMTSDDDIGLLFNKMKTSPSNDTAEVNKKDGADADVDVDVDVDDIDSVSGSEQQDDNMEILDMEQVVEMGEVYKIKVVPIKEQDKVYKDTIQKGDLFNYKLLQYPQANQDGLLKDRILKIINNITILKNKYYKFILEEKPLIARYIAGDYRNTYLIPVVANKKKIYTSNPNDIRELDVRTNEIMGSFYDDLKKPIYERDYRVSQTNYDNRLSNLLNEINPMIMSSDEHIGGYVVRLSSISKFDALFQEILTVRHCDQHQSCQSIALQSRTFDSQINIGIIVNYVDKEELPIEDMYKLEDSVGINTIDIFPDYRVLYSGDMINIIGYIHTIDEITDISSISPTVINMDNISMDIDINKSYMYIFPHGINSLNASELETYLDKIIPSFADIIEHEISSNVYNYQQICEYVKEYGYDERELTGEQYAIIMSKLNTITIKRDIEHYMLNIQKQLEKRTESDRHQMSVRFGEYKIFDNSILEELEQFYDNIYLKFNLDNEAFRINWLEKTSDHGNYIYLLLKQREYDEFAKTYNIDNMASEIEELKKQQFSLIQQRTSSAEMSPSTSASASSAACDLYNTKANIIRYPTLDRLEQDNSKIAYDSGNNQIMVGDYGLVYDSKSVKKYHFFKRENIAGSEMWIREDLRVLQTLIERKKNKCMESITPTDSSAASPQIACVYDTDKMECRTHSEVMSDIEYDLLSSEIKMREMNIDYIKQLPMKLNTLKEDIELARNKLQNIKMVEDRLNKYYIEKDKELEDINNRLKYSPKACVHYGILGEFNARYDTIHVTDIDRYRMMAVILDKFLDEDNRTYDLTKLDELNYLMCNICNQPLICKHNLWIVHDLQNNSDINYDNLGKIYGARINMATRCRICGELLQNESPLDVDDFESGENGRIIRSREILEDAQDEDHTIEHIINKMYADMSKQDDSFQLKKELYLSLLLLAGMTTLNYEDELEMIAFLRSYNFISSADISNQLRANPAFANLPANRISQLINQYKMLYIGCDIAARLLIVLQCSIHTYNVYNEYCVNNIVGYPLLSDVTVHKNGVNFMTCMLNQLATSDKKYEVFTDTKLGDRLIIQIRKQLEDPFIRHKIGNALAHQSSAITTMISFADYMTNRWSSFLPSLSVTSSPAMPNKKLGSRNIDEITASNYQLMRWSGSIMATYLATVWTSKLNTIITSYDVENLAIRRTMLNNTCNIVEFSEYRDMYDGESDEINELKDIGRMLNILYQLANYMTLYYIIFGHKVDVSGQRTELVLKPVEVEIHKMYEKYIDNGINMGYEHIYDEYGRCILSNQMLNDIKRRSYSFDDYLKLANIITLNNRLDDRFIVVDKIKLIKDEEMEYMKELGRYCKENKITFIMNYINRIFSEIDMKKYDVYQHIAYLDGQIQEEIKLLVGHISSTNDVEIKIWIHKLTDLGDFAKLRAEYQENDINILNVNRFRYYKKMEFFKYIIEYWYRIINILANKLIDPTELIPIHYSDFAAYGLEYKLFNRVISLTNKWVEFERLMFINSKYEYMNMEMQGNILHYCIIKMCIDTIEIIGDSKKGGIIATTMPTPAPTTDTAAPAAQREQYDIIMHEDRLRAFELNINLDDGGGVDYTADDSLDMTAAITKTHTHTLEILINFVTDFINKIVKDMGDHDAMTMESITKYTTVHLQKTQQQNLKVFSKLDDNDELKTIIMTKLKLGLIKYKDLYEYSNKIMYNDVIESDDYVPPSLTEPLDNDMDRRNNKLGLSDGEMNELDATNYMGDDNDGDDYFDNYEN